MSDGITVHGVNVIACTPVEKGGLPFADFHEPPKSSTASCADLVHPVLSTLDHKSRL
jgi:hypothetical protein